MNSLINIISKNSSASSEIPIQHADLITSFITQHPVLASDTSFKDYFEYLLYLLNSSHGRHLLRINEQVPVQIKAALLQEVCQALSYSFVRVESAEDL